MSSNEIQNKDDQAVNDIKKLTELFSLLTEIDQDIKRKEKQNDRHD